ncbi:hypothetical protein [Hymenobacter ruber]
MNYTRRLLIGVLSLLAGPAAAQIFTIPPGAYRTGAAYHRKQPQPAGLDATYPDKRGQLVVVVPRGTKTAKLRVAPDSVWGYVSGKGRTFRLFRSEEYRLEYADTLCIYSSSNIMAGSDRDGNNLRTPGANALGPYTAPRYFFSRGLNGLIFPLNTRYLREAYGASNPGFITAIGKLNIGQSLVDFDRRTGLFRVTTLYRDGAGK